MPRCLALLLLVAAVGCSQPQAPASSREQGIKDGVAFLLKQQSDDGAWRSDVYATFKDGTALTPLVLCALQDSAESADTKAARQKASEWLAKMARPDGTIDEGKEGIPYQVYTAALTVTALSHSENKEHTKARDAWLKYLLDRQLTEQNGWHHEDKQYGGWGYYPGMPRKPAPGQSVPGQHLLESNISATAFALDAIAAAKGWDETTAVFLLPESYVLRRYQNDDGGFHFVHDDPVRNKAGASGTGPDGRPRFHSYGSATADGARLAWWCDSAWRQPDPPGAVMVRGNAPAFLKAQWWLEKHFTPDRHPGTYIPTHEPNRNAVYFYYAASVAKTFRLLGVKEVYGRPWAEQLAEALLAKQLPDGSWANPVDLVRENDPIVATAYALTALAEYRKALK
jgi:A-macroglobulin complement component/prenyltransferase/squalene oxidase-like repeat protein